MFCWTWFQVYVETSGYDFRSSWLLSFSCLLITIVSTQQVPSKAAHKLQFGLFVRAYLGWIFPWPKSCNKLQAWGLLLPGSLTWQSAVNLFVKWPASAVSHMKPNQHLVLLVYPFLCGDLVLVQMFVQSLCSIDVVAGWELHFSLTSTLEPYQVHDQ